MDPNSSPWAYAYNRIVPSASGSSDDFQHTHLAQISAAAGSSAQSLLLQAAHSSIAGFNATSGNFVPPTPIGGYNPVFQQIYHHAAQAAVQPKPAHYASSVGSTSHRHLGLSGTVEKQEICRSQPAALGYTTNQSINIPTSSYYGENSSSSGASPSPTTSATSSTTLSWNTPVIGTPQQMSANTFLTMHQQQQQQQAQQQAALNQEKVEEVQKPIPTKKAPRKRQPKKTLLQNNDFSRSSQQNNQSLQQPSRQQQQQQIQHHQPQQQQQQQQQQQVQQQQQQQQQHNSSFYDYNNRWMQPKVENNINIPSFGNTQSQQTNSVPQPQPAHVQSSQTHPHISQISQYYPAFPQHVSTQYAACMSQNNSLYNLTPLGQDTQQEQQQQQNVHQNAQDTLQQQNTSEEVQSEPAADSLSCKVIVPNIEDELHFLTTADPKVSAKVQNNSLYGRDSNNLKSTIQKPPEAAPTYPPFEKKDGPGKKSAFMDSYLKFLQGERDESPPPLMKTGRKYNYQKPCMQKEYVNNNKRKSSDNTQSSNPPSVANAENTSSPAVEGSSAPITNAEGTVTGTDDGHKIKIISQTQILPKKRPQAQNMAAVIQQNPANSEEVTQQHQLAQQQQQQQQLRVGQQQHSHQYRQVQQQTQNFHQDPLALPQRREQSLRKAKARGINEIMQATPAATDRDEPEEFADSDTDPVWTPQDDDSEDGMPGNFVGKRKNRRFKTNASTKKKDTSALKDDTILENDNVNKMALVSSTSNNISENTPGNTGDNFKTGDFIVLRSDLVNDWPIIWQVDSKCILQKYESFCQNGKMFYRNMSKYASWNLDTKKLYIKAPVRIQVQSHTETIVEFMRSELLADDTEQFIEKIMEDYLTYRDHFEIYIQTMISQVLDPSFFSEINREKDEYFLSSVRTIDEIMENCKRKLLSITPWTRSVIVSIETWPQCHVFTEWGQNNVNQKNCGGCHQPGISVRFLLFGHPYNTNTMQTVPVDMRVAYEKDILLCRICAARADIFHKIAHEKYNLFAICTRRVGEHQKELPGKSSTDILNDLLAENNWVDELFRNMRSSWAEVESLERQKRFHEVSQ
ncbi:uncharacterized protein LOC129919977 isoform X2 [Episyrphus balteatus]|uniref:uncharacterized protein LOC129919977 isoform X2 n=1 Tax=Episyrphus balteatus TaxID=286459 RepID=UPI0024861864|nr:uncharacterized protein LOC129919977 isoform X2 [Episyrphus balteatus]